MKIYDSDSLVPYKTTSVNAVRTKSQIDGLLAEYAIKDVAWHWDIANGDIYVMFQFHEKINDKELHPTVKVGCPTIWHKATRQKKEAINWDVSMRVLFWYLKSHLESAYLLQSSKVTEMLPYIQTRSGELVKDVAISKMIAIPEEIRKEERKLVEIGK